jgi:hypothetical protein
LVLRRFVFCPEGAEQISPGQRDSERHVRGDRRPPVSHAHTHTTAAIVDWKLQVPWPEGPGDTRKDLFCIRALFSEPNPNDQDFHAFINWGDGSKITPGHIHGRGNGQYAVLSQHRYVKRGIYAIKIQIRDGIGRKVETESLVRVIR